MSLVYQTTVPVAPWDTDSHGMLRLSEALHYTQQVAGQHCDQLGFPQQFMDDKGLFWAIIRNQLTIHRLPRTGDNIRLETWPMPTTRTCYPRACLAYDEAGTLLFSCHSLWILMDQKTRAMVLPGKSGIDVPGIQRENTPPAPRSLSPIREEGRCRRQVSQEDLDKNNHMNSARYLDWVSALPVWNDDLRSANLCYLNEALEGQMLTICWAGDSENRLAVDIRREKEDGSFDRIFSASFEFDNVVL